MGFWDPNGTSVVFSELLTVEEIRKCNNRAQIDGTIAGLVSGLSTSILISRLPKRLPPNQNALLGFGVGIMTAYYYSKIALKSNLDRCEEQKRILEHGALGTRENFSSYNSETMQDPYAR
ncbi:uncharacterized protein MELLADRAFT_57390 [Melampsora larici-populina 98AG31]|uniref:Uncharacterized protein n=1 Tax=Melampsora larici-populina (strain 98AG31 / pathotype 3-4-7) TaxID=747676 RepID=F4S1S1_MELLP|nr:uncharacterized protein MELLADRAFT_57390 [Melampsora larici-populina 98AG31]EGG01425.1 hypothetical protein MELLADRAFT_57390 [Melampsora larici-populina 98AG31]